MNVFLISFLSNLLLSIFRIQTNLVVVVVVVVQMLQLYSILKTEDLRHVRLLFSCLFIM